MKTGVRVKTKKDLNTVASLLLSIFCLLNSAFLSSCVRDSSLSAFSHQGEKIRIAVLKNTKNLKIEGITAAETDGRSLSLQPRQEGASFTPAIVTLEESGALIVNDSEINGSKIAFFSDDGILSVNGRTYRDRIEVIKDQKGLLVVNELPLEFYVAGLINHEISSKWPVEAVKAQAVIARTYAVYQKKKRGKEAYHMEATVADQVYSGSVAEDDRSFSAAEETAGEVLTYDGEFALTVYHSNSGGMTEDSKNVWGKNYPYLRQIESPFDKDAPNFSWVFTISPQAVATALKDAGYSIPDINDITPSFKTNSGRAAKILVHYTGGNLEMSGEDLRKAMGYDKLKSAMFTVEMINGSFVFNGKGHGHGVGLSQWGAKGMAEKGYTYTEILEHFYPGTRIEKIY